MIVTRPYLKRHMEKANSTSSICFSYDSVTTTHTPLVFSRVIGCTGHNGQSSPVCTLTCMITFKD